MGAAVDLARAGGTGQTGGSPSVRRIRRQAPPPKARGAARGGLLRGLSTVGWDDAARMRDRLVHHYFDIDLDVLWATVTEDLPDLLNVIEQDLGTE